MFGVSSQTIIFSLLLLFNTSHSSSVMFYTKNGEIVPMWIPGFKNALVHRRQYPPSIGKVYYKEQHSTVINLLVLVSSIFCYTYKEKVLEAKTPVCQ
jgi:hypothetical protein